jgi:hypothetical protein
VATLADRLGSRVPRTRRPAAIAVGLPRESRAAGPDRRRAGVRSGVACRGVSGIRLAAFEMAPVLIM